MALDAMTMYSITCDGDDGLPCDEWLCNVAFQAGDLAAAEKYGPRLSIYVREEKGAAR